MIAVSRDFPDQKNGAARRQFVSQRNLQSFCSQLRIACPGQRVVVVLFLLGAGRCQTEFAQFVPGCFIGVVPHDREDRRSQIRGERSKIDEVLLKSFAAAADNFLIVQITERRNQASAQTGGARRLIFLWFPAQLVEARAQDRTSARLKFFADGISNEQAVDEIESVNDLLALGQFREGRQFFDQTEVHRQRCAIRLHESPGVA